MKNESNPTCWGVVPASGTGSRMRADRPKQYLRLGNKTILEHTLDNLLAFPPLAGVVLVLDEHDEHWATLGYQHEKPVLLCAGGMQRYHSVLNGLEHLHRQLGQDSPVLIHDAVRPFVSHEDLERVLQASVQQDDGAILAVPLNDTLKLASNGENIASTQSRQDLWRAFTPQPFRLGLVRQAILQAAQDHDEITDDASAMERMGYRPKLVKCNPMNIKITHPADLALGELILKSGAWTCSTWA